MKTYQLHWVNENDNCTRHFLATTKAILEYWKDGEIVYASGFNNLEELKELLNSEDLVISKATKEPLTECSNKLCEEYNEYCSRCPVV